MKEYENARMTYVDLSCTEAGGCTWECYKQDCEDDCQDDTCPYVNGDPKENCKDCTLM